jgi:hypothetical protein
VPRVLQISDRHSTWKIDAAMMDRDGLGRYGVQQSVHDGAVVDSKMSCEMSSRGFRLDGAKKLSEGTEPSTPNMEV